MTSHANPMTTEPTQRGSERYSQPEKEALGHLAFHVLGADSSNFSSEHARLIMGLLARFERLDRRHAIPVGVSTVTDEMVEAALKVWSASAWASIQAHSEGNTPKDGPREAMRAALQAALSPKGVSDDHTEAAHLKFRREAFELAMKTDPQEFGFDFDPHAHNTVEGLARTLAIVAGGYAFTLTDEGYLAGCVAGDQGYAVTGICVDDTEFFPTVTAKSPKGEAPEGETIVAAAIQYHGLTVSLPPPARHHTILHPLADIVGKVIGPDEQGFLTSTGRFVGRFEARDIAIQSGQNRKPDHQHWLFSEDLW
jgi:hypothetical protein